MNEWRHDISQSQVYDDSCNYIEAESEYHAWIGLQLRSESHYSPDQSIYHGLEERLKQLNLALGCLLKIAEYCEQEANYH